MSAPRIELPVVLMWGTALWVAAAQLAWLLSGWLWWAEALDAGLVAGALFALFGGLLAALRRRWRLAGALSAALAVDLLRWLPHPAPHPPGGRPVKVLLANVLSSNTDRESLLWLVEQEEPDIVGLMEVNGGWHAALEPLRARYPHRLEHPRSDNFGISLYSALPVEDLRVVWLGSQLVPSIAGELPGGVTLVLTHPPPPVSGVAADFRRRQLDALEAMLLAADGRYVALGDLNAVPWGASFPAVPVRGGLPWGTFPSWWGLPLDHVLAGSAVGVLQRRLGPPIGSDHRPVLARLDLPVP